MAQLHFGTKSICASTCCGAVANGTSVGPTNSQLNPVVVPQTPYRSTIRQDSHRVGILAPI